MKFKKSRNLIYTIHPHIHSTPKSHRQTWEKGAGNHGFLYFIHQQLLTASHAELVGGGGIFQLNEGLAPV